MQSIVKNLVSSLYKAQFEHNAAYFLKLMLIPYRN